MLLSLQPVVQTEDLPMTFALVAFAVAAAVVASHGAPSVSSIAYYGPCETMHHHGRVHHRPVHFSHTIHTNIVQLGTKLRDKPRHLWPHSRRLSKLFRASDRFAPCIAISPVEFRSDSGQPNEAKPIELIRPMDTPYYCPILVKHGLPCQRPLVVSNDPPMYRSKTI